MQQATFFRRQAWADVGGFEVASKIVWDTELLIDMALAGKKTQRVPGDWGLFRIYPATITGALKGGKDDPRARELAAARERDRERILIKVKGRRPRW